MQTDADEDLGDVVTPEQAEIADKLSNTDAAGRVRDEHGRFVTKADDVKKDDVKKDDDKKEKEEPDPDAEEEEEEADPEAEEEADPESEEEEEEEPAKGKNRFQERVNKLTARTNDAVARAAALEAENAALRAQQAEATKKTKSQTQEINERLDTLYETVEKHRADGEQKEAAAAQREIDKLNRDLNRIESVATARAEAFQVGETERFNVMLDVLEARYDIVNPQHADFDPSVAREVDFQVKAYEKMGMPATQALTRAVTLIFQENPFDPKAVAKTKPDKEEKGSLRRGTDVKKNLDAEKKGIPKGGKGSVPDKINIAKTAGKDLSPEEIAKLPKDQQDDIYGNTFVPTED